MTATAGTAHLFKVADADAHEGPVWLDGALFFTSLPRFDRPGHPLVAIRRLDVARGRVTTIREDANAANGMTLGRDGRLLVCEQGTMDAPARIAALDPSTGEAETVVDALAGLPLNSPNDFRTGVDDLIKAEAIYPGWLSQLLTTPIRGLENHTEMIRALTEDRDAIKVYVEVASAS